MDVWDAVAFWIGCGVIFVVAFLYVARDERSCDEDEHSKVEEWKER